MLCTRLCIRKKLIGRTIQYSNDLICLKLSMEILAVVFAGPLDKCSSHPWLDWYQHTGVLLVREVGTSVFVWYMFLLGRPIFLILDGTGIEKFELPTGSMILVQSFQCSLK